MIRYITVLLRLFKFSSVKVTFTGLLVSAIISGALEIQGWLWLHQCSRATQGLVGMIGTWAGLCSVKLLFDDRNLC